MMGWITSTVLFALSAPASSSSSSMQLQPRSNATHLYWNDNNSAAVRYQTIADARKESLLYLRNHLMAFDEPFLETLGFVSGGNETDVDGLKDGMVASVIDVALSAKRHFAYTDQLPKEIWREYVLNYASLNEGRTSIRKFLYETVVTPLLLLSRNQTTPVNRTLPETVRLLNTKLWTMLSKSGCIVFQSGQTPAIFDAMSVIVYGHASCTGLSILFVEACRAAGVPARVAGTAAWNGRIESGNHNWVEIFNHTEWTFLEPSPNQTTVDDLDRPPCSRWFCHAGRFHNTSVFAARLEYPSGGHFPLAWERDCTAVPGENRTEYYQRVCECGKETVSDA